MTLLCPLNVPPMELINFHFLRQLIILVKPTLIPNYPTLWQNFQDHDLHYQHSYFHVPNVKENRKKGIEPIQRIKILPQSRFQLAFIDQLLVVYLTLCLFVKISSKELVRHDLKVTNVFTCWYLKMREMKELRNSLIFSSLLIWTYLRVINGKISLYPQLIFTFYSCACAFLIYFKIWLTTIINTSNF